MFALKADFVVLANVLIDLEVIYCLSRNEAPIHRYCHTYAGRFVLGLVAGVFVYAVGRILCRLKKRDHLTPARVGPSGRLSHALVAGLFGGLSHILLDSLMHDEMAPLWPLADGNALAGVIGTGSLHIALAVAGFFGVVLWLLTPKSPT